MKSITTEITIQAPAQKIWDILMDFDAYPDWNPMVRSIHGETAVGARLETHLQLPGNKPMKFKPHVVGFEPAQEFRWLGMLLFPGLFDGEHSFALQEQPDGSTSFTHSENFSGLLVPLFWKGLAPKTEAGFVAMNEALKQRAEAS